MRRSFIVSLFQVFGEYTEYSIKAVNIEPKNVKEKADLLVEQYGRTGSLFPHNVVLVPIGDDFRYDHEMEWDQQYKNYQRLMDYINSHPNYHVDIRWGTLKDYFYEVCSLFILSFTIERGTSTLTPHPRG